MDYWPNGLVKLEGQYAVLPHGRWRRFTHAGLLLEELHVVHGVRDGWYRRWHAYMVGCAGEPAKPRRTLAERGRFIAGKKHGLWLSWALDGRWDWQHVYQLDERLRSRSMGSRMWVEHVVAAASRPH